MRHYVFRVDGRLPDQALATLPLLATAALPAGAILRGHLPDQTALPGVLGRLDDLGVRIVDFTQVPSASATVPRQADAMARPADREPAVRNTEGPAPREETATCPRPIPGSTTTD